MIPLPASVNNLITDQQGQLSTYPFPDNVADESIMPKELRQQIVRWMIQHYVFPQVTERKPFEDKWDKLLLMAKVAWKLQQKEKAGNETRVERRMRERRDGASPDDLDREDISILDRIEIGDTIIFDAIDRLTNLNHFIGFKEGFPARFEKPKDMVFPHDNATYSPADMMVKSINCWLNFNVENQDIYRKYHITARHHYTYGISMVASDYVQKIEMVPRRMPDNTFRNMPELTDIGITFEPLSLRKVWMNWRIPIWDMKYQGCPFYFSMMPRFALTANPYNRQTNPFGFANLQNLPQAQYLFAGSELRSWLDALQEKNGVTYTTTLDPKLNVELLWTFFPMLPLANDPQDPTKLIFDEDGSLGIPYRRFIVQLFGNNLLGGNMEMVRCQRNFYPKDDLPIYGSAHMPSLDDGLYSTAIGEVLEGHYVQSCKCMMQYIENKDFINDPSVFVQALSPAMDFDINQKSAKIPVNSINDIKQRDLIDATMTTPAVLQMVREQAQTSSKAVDAILGKAMGSRTSATEAGNVFQTAMSGVTTDVNIFAHDIAGGYCDRIWDYTQRWVDPDVLGLITGSYGFAIRPEYWSFKLGLKWDVGSSFIDSLTRQQNLKYLLQASPPGDPTINRAALFRQLLEEWNFKNVDAIVNDGGVNDNIQMATLQAVETYMGLPVMVDPDQDHTIAIKVKNSFLRDRNSVWNTDPRYAVNAQLLVQQLQIHQQFLQLQMQMQMLQQLQMSGMADGGGNLLHALQNSPIPSPNAPASTPGQARQVTGT